ncbi:MAG: ATP-binding protein [Prevotella sp.]|nr:ATP-binding protein [Prevotella sp.]
MFIFDNRVEVISPGALAGGLTEEDIRNGKTYQRNPFMATFATNALHYRGIGSGIVRILAECPNVDIQNDCVGNEFKVTIFRGVLDTIQKDDFTIQKTEETIPKKESTTPKDDFTIQKKESTIQKGVDYSEGMVLKFFYEHPKATIDEAVDAIDELSLGGVKFIIAKLQQKGLLKRVGGRKHGEWVVCHDENNTK